MLKKSASTKKVEVEAKVEITKVWSLLNLDLDLSLLYLLEARLNILQGCTAVLVLGYTCR
jgi:hypothetical protein